MSKSNTSSPFALLKQQLLNQQTSKQQVQQQQKNAVKTDNISQLTKQKIQNQQVDSHLLSPHQLTSQPLQQTPVISNDSIGFADLQPSNIRVRNTVDVSLEDKQLLQKELSGVKKLDQSDVVARDSLYQKKPVDAVTLAKRAAAEGDIIVPAFGISDQQALLKPVASEAILSYRNTTVQHRVFDELKGGKLRWYQAVDLHGCTMEEAREAVLAIIQHAQLEGQTSLKIVHGKGKTAVLKTCVNGWLQQHPQVLAFHSAPENQGGTGSVLVLIKKVKADLPKPY